MTQTALFTVVALLAAVRAVAGDAIIDPASYADDRAAQAAWKPMTGSAPAGVGEVDGRRVVRLPCNFAGTKIPRASWDVAVKLDLTRGQGLRLALRCKDAAPISHFAVYLQSGDGWYTGTVAPAGGGQWSEVSVRKEETHVEGRPAGWARVSTIRLSAWRGQDQDTELLLGGVWIDGTTPERETIAVVRGEVGGASSNELTSACEFAQSIGHRLRELGLSYTLLSDADLTAERLAGRAVVVLPFNPGLPAPATDALLAYVQGGGKLLAFYNLPSKLAQATGLTCEFVRERDLGSFASIRAAPDALPGQPPVVAQHSWNLETPKRGASAPGRRDVAFWFDKAGNNTGYPAVSISGNVTYMSHVLLADDLPNQRRLLLAMLGQAAPQFWPQAAQVAVARAGRIGSYETFEQAAAQLLRAQPARPELPAALAAARAALAKADGTVKAGRPLEAMDLAEQARRHVLEAYCLAQPSAPGEFRAFWCHSAFGIPGMSWDEAIRTLADNGFNAILPNMLWGGVAYYDSAVLPVAPEVKEQGDQIAACLAACRKYGVQCHVWKVNWNMGGRTPREFAQRMRQDGRTQVHFDGKPNPQWLCPSQAINQQLEIDAMVEVATKYDVDGVHFDYIRYPDENGCFCDRCREAFERAIGRKVEHWPADVRKDEALKARWNDFRRDNITRVVGAVSERLRKDRPKVKISAAVFRNWAVDRDGVGQDWKLWCERGYVDFLCPMDYTPHAAQLEQWVTQQIRWAGKVPIYPGIGVSLWPSSPDPVTLAEQVALVRRLGARGFTCFNYDNASAHDLLPLAGKGLTRKE